MPVISLISDLGLRDATVGIVKGVIYTSLPTAIITDITHEVAPFRIAEAAWLLGDAYAGFPSGTVHIVLVDTFYQAQPQMLLATMHNQFVLAPANGLLSRLPTVAGTNAQVVYTGVAGQGLSHWVHAAAAVIAQIQVAPAAAYHWPQVQIPEIQPEPLQITNNTVYCHVLYIDNFGNLITNFTQQDFLKLGGGRPFKISVGVEIITRIHSACSDVAKGDALCRFNSRGFLQICVNKGNAASLLGFRIGGIYNHIKIQFG